MNSNDINMFGDIICDTLPSGTDTQHEPPKVVEREKPTDVFTKPELFGDEFFIDVPTTDEHEMYKMDTVCNTIPKIDVVPCDKYIIIEGNREYVVYVSDDDINQYPTIPLLIRNNQFGVLNDMQMNTNNIYKINVMYLKKFIYNVLSDICAIHPMLYVNFVRKSMNVNTKIVFDQYELLKLNTWVSQLYKEHVKLVSLYCNCEVSFDADDMHCKHIYHTGKTLTECIFEQDYYIAYVICCEILDYARRHICE